MYRVAHYPGVVRSDDPKQIVVGELYRVIEAQALFALLDDYEECSPMHPAPHEYVRSLCPVSLPDGSPLSAWVYLYARDVCSLPFIDSGRFE